MEQNKPEGEDQQEWERLANEVESRLREYLDKAAKEYPPGCQADWLSGVAAERLLAESSAGCTATPVSLVKLSIYLMESLADVSNAYEEFYAQQVAELREDGLAAHAQVASLEDENARLREQLHRRAEELRLAQAAAETLKSTASGGDSSAGVVGRHRFDEAVDVEDEDEVEEEVSEESEAVGGAAAVAAAACGSSGGAVCRQCGRGGGDAESAAATKAAVQIAALKADLADWEADMAEKVHQNVELAAQLEACQRQLARQAARAAAPSAENGTAAAPRGIFSGLPLLRRKT
ncbi:hypothetical protein BOX15_Mlig007969g1 [Macrostomum lignano]|uniref:Uncharacterized protein n=2 Tax=Macrostomum lignano TaxID=282301 RepID=A0A267DBB5_9PLAT|nr:hypothetical protein BOX15_Mlig007969g1 [Macrostomum lignano]